MKARKRRRFFGSLKNISMTIKAKMQKIFYRVGVVAPKLVDNQNPI